MTTIVKASEVKALDVLVFGGYEHTVRKIATDNDKIYLYFSNRPGKEIALRDTPVTKKV